MININDVLVFLRDYIAVPSVITAIILFTLKKFLGDKVDHYFNEKITLFKHKLDLSTEEERFNYQRKIQDFSLYTIKKHEKYIKLYELTLEAEARILGIYGARSELSYQEHNEKDFRRIMTEENFPDGKIDSVFKTWEERGKEEAIKEMKHFMRLIEIKKADDSFHLLKNHFIISKLYLSEMIDKKYDSFLSSLGQLLVNYEMIENMPYDVRRQEKEMIKEGQELRKTIRPQIDELTILLKKELSVGYY